MTTATPKQGFVFVCMVGHISNEANQLGKKKARFCIKDLCALPVEQLRYITAKNIYYRGAIGRSRMLAHCCFGDPL